MSSIRGAREAQAAIFLLQASNFFETVGNKGLSIGQGIFHDFIEGEPTFGKCEPKIPEAEAIPAVGSPRTFP